MNKKIRAQDYSIPVDLQSETLESFWKTQSKTKPNRPTLTNFSCKGNMEKLLALIGQAKKTVCLQSEILESQSICTACVKAAQRGIRVYVLLGRLPQTSIGVQPLVGKCLIRSGFKSIGSYVLADTGFTQARGYLFTHSLEENSLLLNPSDGVLPIHWMITLDSEQIKEFHTFFCHNFWNLAQDEILDTSDLGKPRKVSNSPFGDIPLPQEHYRSEELLKILENCLNQQTCYASVSQAGNNFFSALAWDKFTQGKILTSVLGNEQKLIATIGDKVEIYAFDSTNSLNCFLLPNSIGSCPRPDERRDRGYLIPKAILSPKDSVYALRLNPEQWDEALTYFNYLVQESNYKFIRKEALHEIKTPICFLDTPEKELEIRPSVSQSFGYIDVLEVASLQNPDTRQIISQRIRPVRELLALQVEYSFTLHPPYLPEKANPDRLYAEWESVQNEYHRYLENLASALEKIEERRALLSGRVWEGLKSFFTGKTQWSKEKKERVNILQKLDLSKETSQKREEIVKELNAMTGMVSQTREEIEEEIEKQKALVAWEDRKQELEKELAEKKEKVAGKEKGIQEFEKKYEEGLAAKEEEYCQTKEKIAKELRIESKAWEDKRAAWEIESKQGKEKKSKAAKASLEKMRKVDRVLTTWKNSQHIEKGMLDRQIESYRNEVKQVENKLLVHGEKFVYKVKERSSSSHSSLSGVMSGKQKKDKASKSEKAESSRSYAPIFPKEELPKTGELYQESKERYLAIQYWEQLELAEKEALRLRAQVCVSKEE